MDKEKLLFDNERFIRCIINGNEASDVRCKLARLRLKEQFIQCGKDNYALTRRESLYAYHRAVAQVLLEVKSNRVDVYDTHLENRTLVHYGYDILNELAISKHRNEVTVQQQNRVDY